MGDDSQIQPGSASDEEVEKAWKFVQGREANVVAKESRLVMVEAKEREVAKAQAGLAERKAAYDVLDAELKERLAKLAKIMSGDK